MKSRAPAEFWRHFDQLWSVRVGDHYRAVARKKADHWMWFWIGSHEEYNHLAKRLR